MVTMLCFVSLLCCAGKVVDRGFLQLFVCLLQLEMRGARVGNQTMSKRLENLINNSVNLLITMSGAPSLNYTVIS